MINPSKITDFNRTQAQLEEFLLFSIIVAGKVAVVQAEKLEQFLDRVPGGYSRSPFEKVNWQIENGSLLAALLNAKIGQYRRITQAFREAAQLGDLRNVTLAELEAIHGIGPKTARFFLVHSRPGQQMAALDTHILSWLRERGHDAPKSTPTGAKYAELEQVFLGYCAAAGRGVAEMDLEIWNARTRFKKV